MQDIAWKLCSTPTSRQIWSFFSSPAFVRRLQGELKGQLYEGFVEETSIYFIKTGQWATFCDRAISIDAALLRAISGSIFSSFADVNYVEFPHLVESSRPVSQYRHWRAKTHECARVALGATSPIHESKNIRYKFMRLKRTRAADKVVLEFNEPAKIENATRIIALNRTTIESKGKRYGVDTSYEADIVAACAGTGVDISLFVDSKLISGAIFYVCGKRAFLQTVGFDGEFAKYSPGLLCLSEAIKRFHAMGLLEINLMWGRYNYKEQLGGKRESLFTYTFVRNEKALLSPMHVARAVKLAIVMPAKSRIRSLVQPLVRTLKEKVIVPRKSS
jgi:hypothetical protein